MAARVALMLAIPRRRLVTSARLCGEEMYRGLELERRNQSMGRPLSPFLSSYKMHLPMATSLLHRISGAGYSTLYYGTVIGIVALSPNIEGLIDTLHGWGIQGNVATCLKFAIAWPATYHMFNGIRHLAWDAGKGFALPTVYKTIYVVVTVTTIVAAAVAML